MSVRLVLDRGTYLFKLCHTGTQTFMDNRSNVFDQSEKTSSIPFTSPESIPNQHCAFVWVVTFVLIGLWLTSTIKDHCCMLQTNKKRSSSSRGWADAHTNTTWRSWASGTAVNGRRCFLTCVSSSRSATHRQVKTNSTKVLCLLLFHM